MPDLSALEPAVAAQLEKAIAWLGPRIEGGGTDAAEAGGELAMIFHAYGLTDPARAAYARAVELDPGHFEWTYLAAALEHSAGRLERAAELYSTAIVLNPDHWPARIRLAETQLEDGKLEAANATLAPIPAGPASSPAVLALRGRIALAARRYDEAVKLLAAALAAEPRADRLHYPLALAYRGQGDLEKAKTHLALRGEIGVRAPDPPIDELSDLVVGERVYLLRGHAAFRAGDYPAAAEAFALAVEARPDSARARVDLGAALGLTGQTEAAIEAFRRALDIEPMNPTAHFNLGRLLVESGRVDEALPNLQIAAQAKPNDLETQVLLGRALLRTGQLEEAAAHFDQLVGDTPGTEDGWLGGAESRIALGRWKTARDILEAATRTLPQSGRIARELAWLLATTPDASLRDGTRAVELAEQVWRARPTPTHARIMAAAQAESGRCELAADWQLEALDGLVDIDPATRRRLEAEMGRYVAGPPCRLPIASSQGALERSDEKR